MKPDGITEAPERSGQMAGSAFDLEAAKEYARSEFGSATAFRVGISAAKLGMESKNLYPSDSRCYRLFNDGFEYWHKQNDKIQP
jgi:hypothetical protein